MDVEDLSCLTGDWRIFQRRDGHRWSLDDLVTAWVAVRAFGDESPARVVDLGSGIGAVLLMMAWRFPSARCVGIEAQSLSVGMARRSIAWNRIGDRCEVRLGDLRDADLVEGTFDLVTATPPYLVPGTASVPARVQQEGCHIELRGGIEDYCDAASRMLAPRGRFVVCHSDVARTEHAMDGARLTIDARLDVIPREGKQPLFSVFTAKKWGQTYLRDAKIGLSPFTIVVRDRGGEWTDAFRTVRREMGMPV
jgi:tRNA1(Val) A37 N6-methylase TrmN6